MARRTRRRRSHGSRGGARAGSAAGGAPAGRSPGAPFVDHRRLSDGDGHVRPIPIFPFRTTPRGGRRGRPRARRPRSYRRLSIRGALIAATAVVGLSAGRSRVGYVLSRSSDAAIVDPHAR